MADFWDSFLTNLTATPQSTAATLAGIGTLIDPAKPQTTTQQANVQLPSYIAPYVGRMLERAEGLSQEDYIPYTGQRVADFSSPQQQAFQGFQNMTAPNTGAQAGIATDAAQKLLNTSYAPNTSFGAPSVGTSQWDSTVAGQYMSPYMQSVTDIAKRNALEQFQGTTLPGIRGLADKAGAYGGARMGVMEGMAHENINKQLSDLDVQGLQSAYTSGMGQFNADQGRGLQAQTTNAGNSLQAQQLGEGSRQFGANLGVTSAQAAPGAATAAGNLAQQGFANQNTINQNLLGIGTLQQQQQQKGLDVGFQQFQDQVKQPYTQNQYMQSFLSGLPMTQTAVATTTPAPTLTQQLVGNTGSAYYGLGSLFGG